MEWLQYIINNFIEPWGYVLNGEVNWQGERAEDIGTIVSRSAKKNKTMLRYIKKGIALVR